MSNDINIKCFVIMPFSKSSNKHTGEYWTRLFKDFLKPIIEEVPNVIAERSKARREGIVGEIIKNLIDSSDVVVADLTDFNPNVFWELGVRQSFKHGTVTIAEAGTKIPFDIGGKGTLFYHPKDLIKNEEFRTDFKSAIEDCIRHPNRPDSTVLELISGRGSFFEIIRRDEVVRRITAFKSEFKINKKLFNDVINQAKLNKEIEDGGTGTQQIITRRFRTPSVELLITNRYIDTDDKFYHSAELFYDSLNVLNDQLRKWSYAADNAEKWFLEHEIFYRKNRFDVLEANIETYLKDY